MPYQPLEGCLRRVSWRWRLAPLRPREPQLHPMLTLPSIVTDVND